MTGVARERRWAPSRLAVFLGRASPMWEIRIADGHVVVRSGNAEHLRPLRKAPSPAVHSGVLWPRIDAARWGIATPLCGARRSTVRSLLAAIDFERAVSAANDWFAEFHALRTRLWDLRRWFTEELIAEWEASRRAFVAAYRIGAVPWDRLDQDELAVIAAVTDGGWVRQQAAALNEALVARELRDQRDFFDNIEKTPLTEEQARAVVVFDNRVQLIAAAGSGKTSTMVAKAAWAIRRGIAKPEEILLLAFNKAAAAELQERCIARLGHAGIPHDGLAASTFHAFGLRVIGEATGRKPRLASGLEDDDGMRRLGGVIDWLRRSDPRFAWRWALFRDVLGVPLEFDPEPDAYDAERKRTGWRALDGRVFKSAGERAIANWLLRNGVAFEYERPYEHDVATASASQYRPDFYYTDVGVYHEHWAFTEEDEVPDTYAGYLDQSEWKRRLHRDLGTSLIETAARQIADGSVFFELERQLEAAGVTLEFDPDREFEGPPAIDDQNMVRLFRTFLAHAKGNRLDDRALRERLGGGASGLRERTFLELFSAIRAEWDERLRAEGAVDFEDMLNQATDIVESGRWSSPYSVVMVDEFQDASHARARLVSAVVAAPGNHLFAVGDDWQSIYRFAGADISAMTQFERLFGRAHVLRLQATFRNPAAVTAAASEFVMRNPEQLRKSVQSVSRERGSIALRRVVATGATWKERMADLERVTREAISDRLAQIAQQLEPGASTTVKVLGRYRGQQRVVPKRVPPGIDIHFQTVHSSKGLEADHVVIVGADRGAFPSAKQDDPLLRLALPAGDTYPFAEERRLFYVALTRARRSVLIIARAKSQSEFVTELLASGRITEVDGELVTDAAQTAAEVCPACGQGLLVERQGSHGPFLGCNRFPACQKTERLTIAGRSR